jgi:hypothetical protein
MSTKFFMGLIAVIVVLAAAYFILFSANDGLEPSANATTTPQNPSGQQFSTYSNTKYGLSFSYSSEYQLTEMDAPGSALRERHIIVLQRKEDLPPPEGGEGPPSITIDIYQNNLDHQTTEGWIRGTSESNFKLGTGDLASTTIAGMPAFSYRWSGLYEGTTVAIALPNWIYAFSVTYFEPGADIVQDFAALRESVRIGPSQTP